jgi:ketosteroid isomerase-like protein
MTDQEQANLASVRRYLAALEGGATGEVLAAFFTPDVVQEELPNRLVELGAVRGLDDILAGAERGQKVMAAQRFELVQALASGDWVAVEARWTGTLRVAYGVIPKGGEMHARFAIFLQFRDGRIARQRNYDCFDPW